MLELKTEADCRLLYFDILHGYSSDSSGKIFIKHSTELDYCFAEKIRCKFLEEGLKIGLSSEKDKLQLLASKGIWTEQEEKTYKEAVEDLESLRLSSRNLIIPQQIEDIKNRITKQTAFIKENFGQRTELIGTTKETYASRRASELHILYSFFKDTQLTKPCLTDSDIDELGHKQVNFFMDIYESVIELFSDKNMKRVAVCPFFLSSYLVANEDPFIFYGKPMIQLSIYQTSLFNRGRYYKRLLEEPEIQRVPEEYYEDLDKVIVFYDKQYSIIQSKRRATH